MRKTFLLMLLVAIFGTAAISNVEAVIKPGFRAGAYFEDSDAFIGGEVLWSLTEAWYFNPNIEYVFVENGSLWTFNADFHYDFETNTPFFFWLGAGPAILHRDFDGPRDSNTDLGVNLFGGIGFPLSDPDIIPYIQPKVILSDNSQFSLAFGIRF